MNSEHESLDDKRAASDFEAKANRVEAEPERPLLVIRTIQFLLAAILIGIVMHGLLTRSPNGEAPTRHSVDTSPTAGRAASLAAPTLQANAPSSSASRSPVASGSRAAPTYDDLGSLHAIRDYLELHRVTRETRAYQLGLTSRDTLVQLAITSEPNR